MNWEIISKQNFTGITGYGLDADTMVKTGVIAGIKFLEENSQLNPEAQPVKSAVSMFPPETENNEDMEKLRDIISPYMVGGTGAMFEHAVSIAYFWKINGTEKFLEKLDSVLR